jgi:hypothetical protein
LENNACKPPAKRIAPVTGANKGIGFEIERLPDGGLSGTFSNSAGQDPW